MEKQVYNYTQLFNNFSENLKKKRKELGLTQKELAEIVGITPKTIQNYEKENYSYSSSDGRNFNSIKC